MKKYSLRKIVLLVLFIVGIFIAIGSAWSLTQAKAALKPGVGGLLPVSLGQLGAVPNDPCTGCHTLQDFASKGYDHSKADFALVGLHVGVTCTSCHTGTPTMLKGLPQNCYSCHASKDPHGGSNGTNCGQCHTPAGWLTNVSVDHSKTAFPLTGAHVTVPCASCHINGVYAGTPKTCYGCHANIDAHNGQNGQNCQNCHNTTSWQNGD